MGKTLIVVGLVIAAVGPRDRARRAAGAVAGRLYLPAGQLLVLLSAHDVDPREHRPHAGGLVLGQAVVRRGAFRVPSIKADRWIKRMALEHRMIEPFEDRQVRAGVISYGLSSYGYDIRVADEFKIFTNINSTVVDPKSFDARNFVDSDGRRLYHPAELVCPGQDGRVLPHPARRPHGVRRQVHLRPVRPDRERDAVRAGMGGLRHAGDFEHHAAAGEGLRERRDRAGAVLPERRACATCRTPTRRANTRSSRA